MAGAGYKLFNTGDVLTAAQVNTFLMEQTVMVFADAAARTTALTGVVSEGMLSYLKSTKQVEVYNGSAWVASDDPNAIQNTIVDAKGDLIAATANDTPARLAVGSNGDTLVADSAATTGLRWQANGSAGKNFVINGNCVIAQRGTASITLSSSTGTHYPVDRFWVTGHSGATTQQISSISLDGFKNAVRVQRTNGNTTTTDLSFVQSFETDTSIPLQGKTVTLSFWARAGANFSPTSSTLTSRVYTGTGTNQGGFGFSWTGTANPINQGNTLTTSWQRFTATGTIASSATQIQLFFFCSPTGTAGANDWFDITGVQLEIGSVATAFQTATGTLQGELAAAMRYYQRYNSSGTFRPFGVGVATGTTAAVIMMPLAVPMRAEPTSIDYGATLALADGVNALVGVNTVTGSLTSSQVMEVSANVTSGLTQYRTYRLVSNNSAAAYVGFNAEL